MKPDLDPSDRELRWFGGLALVFFAMVAYLWHRRTGSADAAGTIAGFGLLFSVLYYAIPRWRRSIYRAWMKAVWPIGWVVSHLILAIAFYLVITPIALLLRLARRDPLSRSFEPDARTYWRERQAEPETRDYFRQF